MNYTIRDYDAVTDWKAICQVHDRARPMELHGSCEGIGSQTAARCRYDRWPQAWTITLSGNEVALSLYRSEGFIVTRTFDSDNAGYPCTVSRRQRQAPG